MNGNPACQNRTPDNMTRPDRGPAQSITDALAGVDHAQGRDTASGFGPGPSHELAALRDLADAVRAAQRARYDEHAHCAGCGAWMKAGHGPGCWVGAAELTEAELAAQAEAEARTTAPPVPGVTRPLPPYTVRAVLPRYDAEGRHLGWYIAADNACGEWITWRAWEGEAGVLMCDQPHTISGPGASPARHRAAALAELAERARLAYAPPF